MTDTDIEPGPEVEAGPQLRPRTATSYADIEPVEPEWLWEGRIPLGEVTVLAAKGGTGKTFAGCDLAARVTRGDALPGGSPAGPPGAVIIANGEDDPGTVLVHRLAASRADLSRVIDFSEPGGMPFTIGGPGDCTGLLHEAITRAGDVRLVIIDPLDGVSAFGLSSKPRVIPLMRNLRRVARSTGAAIVLNHHTTKAGDVSGSKAIVDCARAVLLATREDDGSVVLSVHKCNMARTMSDPVRYRIEGTGVDGHVEWLGEDSGEGREGGPAQSRVLMALTSSAQALSGQKLASMTGIPYGSVRVILTKLKKRGQVASEARGLWFVPDAAPEPVVTPLEYGVLVEQPQVTALHAVNR